MKQKNKKLYKVLLVDFLNLDTCAEIPYLFHKAGCGVTVFCGGKSWLLKNSFSDSRVAAFWAGPLEFAQELQNHLLSQQYNWIVPVDDGALGVLNELVEDESLAKKILPLSKMENRVCLWSKAGLSLLCRQYNIVTPDFAVYMRNKDPLQLAKSVGYPLVLKIDKSSGGSGVCLCNNKEDLLKNWERLAWEDKQRLVFQKYISGDNIAVEGLFREGRLLAYVASKVTQTIEGEFGVSMVREYSSRIELEPILELLGQAMGINGFGNLTFIRSRSDGKYYLVEADLRPQAWFRLAELAGLDFSKAIKNYFTSNFELIRPDLEYPRVLRSFNREIAYSLNGRHRTFSEIIKWILNKQSRWQFIPTYDIKLLANWVWYLAKYGLAESKIWHWQKNWHKVA